MESKQEELRDRTKRFALRIIKVFRSLPRTPDAQILGKQLLRSGISVGANYRAAGRARSGAEFSAKMGSFWKKLTKRCSGWNAWWSQAL
jgi:four helix bundle protein